MMRPFPRAALLALAALCALSGAPRVRATEPAPANLRVFAAASLGDAFGELAKQLEASHPGLLVRINLAGSQQLAAQLSQGANADVFASADERWMQDVSAHGLLAGEATTFAHNRLVVIVPRTNPARIHRLQDLARRGTKLVLGADAVPVGRYARVAFKNLSADPAYGADFAARVLHNVVSEEENVKAVVGKVQLGEADAGVVYRSDVTPAVARDVQVLELPASASVVASYPIAVLRAARSPELARAFVDLVLSPAGQQALARRGFGVAAGTP